VQRLLRYAYARLGRRYPRVILAFQFQAGHLVVLFGVAMLTLYQRESTGEFLVQVAVIEGLIAIENVVSLRLTSRALRPADRWLSGDRSPDAAVAAWRALVELPVEYLRASKLKPLLITAVPFDVFVTAQLGLRWWAALILLAGSVVVVLYGVALRYLAMELAMRPVLEQISRDLPDDFRIGRPAVPMRLKLLTAMPALNIVTGVVVAGVASSGTATLQDLAVDVVVAVAVAFTTTFYLTLLLTRSIMGPIQDLRQATARVARGDLSVRVPVVAADETGQLAQSFNAAVAGLQEREKLREAFGSYVDPEVAEQVLRAGDAVLEGQEVDVSVLFLDVRDFTAFAERASAREVVDQLNDLWERVIPVLRRHGGHANKLIGDGLLGVFGAPEHVEDHADRAVEAALEIAALVREAYRGRVGVGIGVNSGPVVAGTIGGGGKLDFTVIGDTVNTASRVEEQTRVTGDDLLITDAVRRRVRHRRGDWDEREAVKMKGKREPVRLWAPAQTSQPEEEPWSPSERSSSAAPTEPRPPRASPSRT
jgi:adenylate cyclase